MPEAPEPTNSPLSSAWARILARARVDEGLRADLAAVARALLDALERSAASAPVAAASEPSEVSVPPNEAPVEAPRTDVAEPESEHALENARASAVSTTVPPTSPVDPAAIEALRSLKFGPAWAKEPLAPAPVRTVRAVSDNDLVQSESRCRAKAAAVRELLAGRAGGGATVLGIKAEENSEQALGCLWASNLPWNVLQNPELLANLAEVLEACAEAVALLRLVRSVPEENREATYLALTFLAEAQSMLRVSTELIGPERDDDQETLFFWLRRVTHDEQYLVSRFMRLDDRGNPSAVSDLRQRIAARLADETKVRAQRKRTKDLWSKVNYHADKIRNTPDDMHEDDWRKLVEAVTALLAEGTKPSHRRLRELLVDVYELAPDDLVVGEAFEHVQRSIDEYLATRPPELERRSSAPSPEVVRARDLLAGRTVVLVGGTRRPMAEETLQQAFGLRRIHWCQVSEQNPRRSDWESLVTRADVDLVILMIRWVRHVNSDVATVCAEMGKPCVRLPAGYHPNQVAAQVLRQASAALERRV